jgi:vacuole morphology and inheritance protein 14
MLVPSVELSQADANIPGVDLRLQLLEPDRYPHLYKCLYGLLMLLPQSSAFAALKNRLNSVSSIGYLHIAPRPYVASTSTSCTHAAPHTRQGSVVEAIHSLQQQGPSPVPIPHRSSKYSIDTHAAAMVSNAATPGGSNFDRPNRLKSREEGIIRWTELLEKFRSVQERARRAQRPGGMMNDGPSSLAIGELRITGENADGNKAPKEPARPGLGPPVPLKDPPAPAAPAPKPRGLGRPFGRLGGGAKGKRGL